MTFINSIKRRAPLTIYIILIFLIIYLLLAHFYPDYFALGDKDIILYSSSTIFFYGEQGRVSGGGMLGQYNMTGGGSGGCCKSSEIRRNLGTPKGDITVYWQAMYEQPEIDKFYYAYHPNPEIDIPPKGKYHKKYIIFYSFGHLALRKEALTEEQLGSPKFNLTFYEIGYQVGSSDIFYYKVASNSDFKFWHFLEMPLKEFHSVKGIEVTAEQYKYIMDNKYLDKNAPNLTSEQLAYIKQQNDKRSFFSFIF